MSAASSYEAACWAIWWAQLVWVGLLLAWMPGWSRRGLRFGVWVGAEAERGRAAGRLRRQWAVRMAGITLLGTSVAVGLRASAPSGVVLAGSELVLLGGFLLAFARFRLGVRRLGGSAPPPAHPAEEGHVVPRTADVVFWGASLGVAVALGAWALMEAWQAYGSLPRSIPVHFDLWGLPDRYARKGWQSVSMLPTLSLIFGGSLSGLAWLVLHTRPAVRAGEEARSQEVQQRFRSTLGRCTALLAVATAAWMAVLSQGALQVGSGREASLGPAARVLGLWVAGFALGGAVVLALQYGRRGARLDGEPDESFAGDLAGRWRWVAGLFWDDPDESSTFVEKRLGLGCTVNLGHWKGRLILVRLLGLPLAIVLLVLASGCRLHHRNLPFLVGGIQVNEPDPGRWTEVLREAGYNAVAVTVYARQRCWNRGEIQWKADEPAVEREILEARSRGLTPVLILRVALDHAFPENRFLWHGQIHPTGDADLEAWFREYGAFVQHWAARAEALGVPVLGLASELSTLTSTRPTAVSPPLVSYLLDNEAWARRLAAWRARREDLDPASLRMGWEETAPDLETYLAAMESAERRWARAAGFLQTPDPLASVNRRRVMTEAFWRRLIRRVRLRYSGRLLYAANFDQYQDVGFWDALDVIGVNAYFPLREPPPREAGGFWPPASLQALEEGWEEVLEALEGFRAREGLRDRPVLFTELGYTRRRGSTVAPWAGKGVSLIHDDRGPRVLIWGRHAEDPGERIRAVEALAGALGRWPRPWFRGVLYWKLSTRPEHRAIEPFVCIVGPEDPDPLSRALARLGSEARGRRLRSARPRAGVGSAGGFRRPGSPPPG